MILTRNKRRFYVVQASDYSAGKVRVAIRLLRRDKRGVEHLTGPIQEGIGGFKRPADFDRPFAIRCALENAADRLLKRVS